MPHTIIKSHWLLGDRLKTQYNDHDRMLLALGKKLGIANILVLGPRVTKVLVDTDGNVEELRFIVEHDKGWPKHFCLIWGSNSLIDLEYSSDHGKTWGRVATWVFPYPAIGTAILMKVKQCLGE